MIPDTAGDSVQIEHGKIDCFRQQIIGWSRTHFADLPWRKTSNRWHALAAEIMLQRTRAEQVVPVYLEFAARYLTPSDYLKDERADVFASLGLKWRGKQFRMLAERLSERGMPADKNELLELPGVGPYIASAFRSLHLGIRDVIIDSNVVRLYGRFFGLETDAETRRRKWFGEVAEQLTPENDFRDYNYGVIDFTRAICRPAPKHNECIIRDRCCFIKK